MEFRTLYPQFSGKPQKQKIPVNYVGYQEGMTEVDGFHLVDDPTGSTKAFDPTIHIIMGLSMTAVYRGVTIPEELGQYCHPFLEG